MRPLLPFHSTAPSIISSCILAVALFSCHSGSLDPTGTYIRTSNTELRLLTDTITIQRSNGYSDNLYHITQSSSTYFKNPKDRQFNKRNKPNTITGTLNREKSQIETEDPGKLYFLSDEGNVIRINDIVYEKIR